MHIASSISGVRQKEKEEIYILNISFHLFFVSFIILLQSQNDCLS